MKRCFLMHFNYDSIRPSCRSIISGSICLQLGITLVRLPYQWTNTINSDYTSMSSLVVSVLDSPAVDPRSNPGSGATLLMSEKSQPVYYVSSCHILID